MFMPGHILLLNIDIVNIWLLPPSVITLQLSNDPNIVIAKMDATANDVPSPYEVRGYVLI